MAYSYVNYTGDGSKVGPFSVPFPYIDKSHVHVYVMGIETAFTWLSPSTFELATAPAVNDIIHVCRLTARDERLVNFQNGSLLNADTQNLDSKQLFYLYQEAMDLLVKAGDVDNAIFQDRQSVLDALIGNLDRSMLTSDLLSRIEYADRWYEADEIIESSSDYVLPVYFHTPLQVGIADIYILKDRVDAFVSDADGNFSLLSILPDEFFVKTSVDGHVSGFGLIGGEESDFVVVADKFGIVKPDGTGGTYVPFIVDTETGIVGIDGSLVVTGSITGGSIAAETISAGLLAADSVVADNINVSTLDAISADLGTITAGTIRSTNWGTSAGSELLLSNGTFKYGGSSAPALEWNGTDLNINTGGDITVQSGGDIILEGAASNAGKLRIDGTSYGIDFSGSATGNTMYILPDTSNVIYGFLGSSTKRFYNFSTSAYNQASLDVSDGSRQASVSVASPTYATVQLTATDPGGTGFVFLRGGSFGYGRCFYPGSDGTHLLGLSSNRWSAVYAVNGTIQTSDERDKEHVVNTGLGLDFINKLRPVDYSWLGQTEVRQGLIAQEVEEAADGYPLSALDYDVQTDRYGLNYAEFVTPLIKAVQELSHEVTKLKKERYLGHF